MNTITKIIEELNNRGYKAKAVTKKTNGIEKVGIAIGYEKLTPVFYPNLNLSVEECVSEIINTYKNQPEPLIKRDFFTWDYAKNNLQLCLQKKTDEDIKKRDFLDLEMYVRVKMPDNMSYKVKECQFKDISEDEIFERALQLVKENLYVEDMFQMIAVPFDNASGPKSIIVTNNDKLFGASAICDKELLNNIAKKYDSNLIILPSSIHECIIYVDETSDVDMALWSSMVNKVSTENVEPEQVLGYHAYLYNKENGEITW